MLRAAVLIAIIFLTACYSYRGPDGVSIYADDESNEMYLGDRCEYDNERRPGMNHCQDAASMERYQRDYREYQSEYRDLRN